jgi:hypothetical protein
MNAPTADASGASKLAQAEDDFDSTASPPPTRHHESQPKGTRRRHSVRTQSPPPPASGLAPPKRAASTISLVTIPAARSGDDSLRFVDGVGADDEEDGSRGLHSRPHVPRSRSEAHHPTSRAKSELQQCEELQAQADRMDRLKKDLAELDIARRRLAMRVQDEVFDNEDLGWIDAKAAELEEELLAVKKSYNDGCNIYKEVVNKMHERIETRVDVLQAIDEETDVLHIHKDLRDRFISKQKRLEELWDQVCNKVFV